MQKIISLFKRDYEGTRQVYDELVPGAEWVQAGEGLATIKIDGTSCWISSGVLYKRYDAKQGKTPPAGFIPAQAEPDPITGHWPGWLAVSEDNPADKWHLQALERQDITTMQNGTYELIGPKIQGNPYALIYHELVRHGAWLFSTGKEPPRTFKELAAWFVDNPHVEGVVWHRETGEMVKIKRKDFGLSWPIK